MATRKSEDNVMPAPDESIPKTIQCFCCEEKNTLTIEELLFFFFKKISETTLLLELLVEEDDDDLAFDVFEALLSSALEDFFGAKTNRNKNSINFYEILFWIFGKKKKKQNATMITYAIHVLFWFFSTMLSCPSTKLQKHNKIK